MHAPLTDEQSQALNALEGWLLPDEGACLAALAATVPADLAIVELGSFRGKSTCFLAAGARAGHGARVFAVDTWADYQGYSGAYNAHAFLGNLSRTGLADQVSAIMGAIPDVGGTWTRPIGLLFIDGDHSAEGVTADIRAWTPRVAVGGWLAFHDYGRGYGVETAVDALIGSSPAWGPATLAGSIYHCQRHR